MIRIGTRASALAMWQARHVAALLHAKNPAIQYQIVPIQTTGDTDKTSPLSALGGKGVFVRGLEEALIQNTIDLAVHSLKDVTSHSLAGLAFFAFLTPESICDALVLPIQDMPHGDTSPLDLLPHGSQIGTGSMRRIALLHHVRPDLVPIPIRGNIETRMQKVLSGELQGILLSEAGLLRMGTLPGLMAFPLSPEVFVPAPGQGVIAVQGRVSDLSDMGKTVGYISDPQQQAISETHLGLLQRLGFDCRDPFGVWSRFAGNTLHHSVFLQTARGSRYMHTQTQCPPTDADWAQWHAQISHAS